MVLTEAGTSWGGGETGGEGWSSSGRLLSLPGLLGADPAELDIPASSGTPSRDRGTLGSLDWTVWGSCVELVGLRVNTGVALNCSTGTRI